MEYFILKPNGEQTGTFSIEEIRDMLKSGFIGPDTQYWHEGIDGWRPVTQIEESLNFQPPATTAQKSTPPQPRKLPPSSREVLRPEAALKKSSGPIPQTVSAQTHASTNKLPPKPVENVAPLLEIPPQPRIGLTAEPIKYETPAPTPAKKSCLLHWIFYVASVIVLALAINYASPLLRKASSLFQSEITLNNDETFVLLDPSVIKSFTDDMTNSHSIDALRHQMEAATDPATRTNLGLAIQKTSLFHANEVEQRYSAMHKAERIPPGIYKVLQRLDDQGNPTGFGSNASTWYTISYQGRTLYAHKGAFIPAPNP